mmetsp:Transcript_6088/g.9221  ORF Transcript_6088/g.9221 Transcript_6088/m.9221 type:complete len:200 (+) Transcript_6088:126-725(+)
MSTIGDGREQKAAEEVASKSIQQKKQMKTEIVEKGSCKVASRISSTEETSLTTTTNESQSTVPSSTLYVSNLHPRIVEAHLQKLFGSHGKVTRLQFIRKNNLRNPSMPYSFAFIEYESPASAKAAIGRIHGQTLLGKQLIVRYANDKSDSSFQAKMNSTGTKRHGLGNASEDERLLKRQKSEVDKKIEAVKKALSGGKK